MNTACPPGVCLTHGPFAGWVCPSCSTSVMRRLMWPVLIGALVMGGCKPKVERPVAILDSLPSDLVDDLLLLPDSLEHDPLMAKPHKVFPPKASADTAIQIDTTKVKGVDTTTTEYRFWTATTIRKVTTVTSTTVKIDSTKPLPLPEIIAAYPYGAMNTPPDTLCQIERFGLSLTTFPADSATILTQLARVKACHGKAIVQYPRSIMRGAMEDSLAVATRYLNRLFTKAPGICAYVQDSTILAWWTGDDITSPTEWGPMAWDDPRKLARWDSLGWAVVQKCPGINPWLRARPTQMTFRTWLWTKSAGVQYTGPKRHGDPKTFFAAEIATAKVLKLGLITGLNILNGGCGPDPAKCPYALGTNVVGENGTGFYEMSAAEYAYYGKAALVDPYACGFEVWAWGDKWGSDWHQRVDDIDASKALGVIAAGHPKTSCTQR